MNSIHPKERNSKEIKEDEHLAVIVRLHDIIKRYELLVEHLLKSDIEKVTDLYYDHYTVSDIGEILDITRKQVLYLRQKSKLLKS